MKAITIYTDGACKGNPGPGGWAALIMYDPNNTEEISGGEKYTTNNRMELTAIIEALKILGDKPYEIDLFSDSSYVINAIQKRWIDKWVKNNWVRKELVYPTLYKYKESPVKNSDLWKILIELNTKHNIHYHWVKGHAENRFNNRCDELAVKESNKF